MLTALHAFNATGLAVLIKGSSRPHRTRLSLTAQQDEQIGALLHQSPRTFGKPTSVWTLAVLAEVSGEQGVTSTRLSPDTLRRALTRLGIHWKRAKHWIASPDPEYARKKAGATG